MTGRTRPHDRRTTGGTLVAPPAADVAGLEVAAGRLAGRVVRLVEVLSVRADRAGAGTVVVAVVRPEGPGADRDPVVLKSGPPALVAAGARAPAVRARRRRRRRRPAGPPAGTPGATSPSRGCSATTRRAAASSWSGPPAPGSPTGCAVTPAAP